MKQVQLRAIPAGDKVLQALGDTDLPAHHVLRSGSPGTRGSLRRQKTIPRLMLFLLPIARNAARLARLPHPAALNGTGFWFTPISAVPPLGVQRHRSSVDASGRATTTSNMALAGGTRGGRRHTSNRAWRRSARRKPNTVANNNAAALMYLFCLCQAASAQGPRGPASRPEKPGNEVIISRGELVQIGGGFPNSQNPRIRAGARLREVGTTNRTSHRGTMPGRLAHETALILKVHRSNFFMDGFIESPPAERDRGTGPQESAVPFVEDLGSGAMIETQIGPGSGA